MSTRLASPSKKSDNKSPAIDSASPITEIKKVKPAIEHKQTNQHYQVNNKQKQPSKINKQTNKQTNQQTNQQIN
jgi:hypothetical protein